MLVGCAAIAVAFAAAPAPAHAHVNSPDLVHQGMAGPYQLLVTIRPPEVIPGVAVIEVLAPRPDLARVTLVPIPIRGPAARAAPVADVAARAPEDPRLFRGTLWLMASGSWQVRIHADGPDGAGDLAVPVPALALRTKTMQAGLGVMLLALLAFLTAGMIGIIGVAVRDAPLPAGATPDPARRRRARIAQLATAALLAVAFWAGGSWWGREDAFYRRLIYRPLALAADLNGQPGGQRRLSLTLSDPGWFTPRRLDDLLPDHGHLMHLFVVRLPALDAIAHLHPKQDQPGHFVQTLPALPAGQYALFADVVHASGLAETATTTLTVAGTGGTAAAGDDAVGLAPPLGDAGGNAGRDVDLVTLPDGTRVTWDRDLGRDHAPAPLLAGRPTWFRFQVRDRDGAPVTDLLPYMGMAGHAVFLNSDHSVFAHVHPSGSVPMAALSLVAPPGADPHAGHAMHPSALPPEIAFPYACPRPGVYRIFVQFRRGQVIETAAFDAQVR